MSDFGLFFSSGEGRRSPMSIAPQLSPDIFPNATSTVPQPRMSAEAISLCIFVLSIHIGCWFFFDLSSLFDDNFINNL